MRKNPSGFSLVEAAIVLGIIGLVIGGIWVTDSTSNWLSLRGVGQKQNNAGVR